MNDKPENAPATPETLSEEQLESVSAAGDDAQLSNLNLQ